MLCYFLDLSYLYLSFIICYHSYCFGPLAYIVSLICLKQMRRREGGAGGPLGSGEHGRVRQIDRYTRQYPCCSYYYYYHYYACWHVCSYYLFNFAYNVPILFLVLTLSPVFTYIPFSFSLSFRIQVSALLRSFSLRALGLVNTAEDSTELLQFQGHAEYIRIIRSHIWIYA